MVIIYTSPGCASCRKAKQWLKDNNIEFVEKNIFTSLLNEKEIKRAGMDYWQHLDITRYMNFQEFREMHPGAKIWMATTKAHQTYTDVKFGSDDYIMFGKESAGIPEEILVEHEETCIRIPMLPEIRSLNLSNSVAIVLYEALRQQGFESMQRDGELHRLHWKES